MLLDIKPQNHKPTRRVLVIAKEHGQKQIFAHYLLYRHYFSWFSEMAGFVLVCVYQEMLSMKFVSLEYTG